MGDQEQKTKGLTLLEKAGVQRIDLLPIEQFIRDGEPVFTHGSLVLGEISATSDVDLSIITKNLQSYLVRQCGLDSDAAQNIDYISTSWPARSGRKISAHISRAEFRGSYLEHPFAVEFRPLNHLKNKRSSYILGMIDAQGQVIVGTALCPQIQLPDLGVLNITPQTGVYTLSDDQMVPINIDSNQVSFDIEQLQICTETARGFALKPAKIDEKAVCIWGLEVCKTTSDTPAFNVTPEQQERYILNPIIDSLKLMQKFTGGSMRESFVALLSAQAEVRNQRANRMKENPLLTVAALTPFLSLLGNRS